VVTSLAIFNGVYPAITESSSSISSAASKMSDRIESRVSIIQVGNNGAIVEAWLKNIGINEITNIEQTDLFFGSTENFGRITYASGPDLPYWEYQIEGGNAGWTQAVTINITIHLTEPLIPGKYVLKAVIPNGISDQTTFSVK
jgi:hypothetical protein